MTRILISTGDHSADIHGEALVKAMRLIQPSLHVTALGGSRLKSTADQFLRDMVELDVSGFSQPIKQFFTLKNILQKQVFPILTSHQVDAVVLIDYYGFNIHIAEKAKQEKIPVFYFISPQVWASRISRIKKLKTFVTKMLVIFPFEETLYQRYGVPVEFVGHPLIDAIAQLEPSHSLPALHLGLMPGSRPRELVRHIPLLIQSYLKLKKKFQNLDASLFEVDFVPEKDYESLIQQCCQKQDQPAVDAIRRIRQPDYKNRLGITLCLTASGTATLENALLGIPMVVVYQTSPLTYWIARKIIQVPHISMPNILAGKEIIPELIQNQATPETVSETASRYFSSPDLLAEMKSNLAELKERLGPPGAYRRAARAILGNL